MATTSINRERTDEGLQYRVLVSNAGVFVINHVYPSYGEALTSARKHAKAWDCRTIHDSFAGTRLDV